MEDSKIILNDDEIKIEILNNLLNVKNTIIKHYNGDYAVINNNIDLSKNKQFWICDNGLDFNIEPEGGINFYHKFSQGEKGIILDYPLNGDFNLKFKLNYQTIVNFYLGTEHIINFRNKKLKSDFPLKTNVWHDIEVNRKNGIVSMKVNGELIKTINLNQSLFIIRVYNSNRKVNIKEFYATVEENYTTPITKANGNNLEDRILHLESYVNKLASNQDVLDLKNDLNKHETITKNTLDAYNYLFNNIYLDYELKPKKLLNNLHLLINEIIEFIANVCKKYDLTYWLDYGNLLGAVRHGDYIPWDDDADIGMLRKDYYKFEKVIEKEIKEHGLNDYLKLSYHDQKINNQTVKTFIAIRLYYKLNSLPGKRIISNVDVFPYDYMKTYEKDTHLKKIKANRTRLRQNKLNKMDKDENLKKYFDDLNLSLEKRDYMIPGVGESVVKPFVVETDKVFPLKKIKFGEKIFPCPNDTDYYLNAVYGDYMHIPKILHRHSRMSIFRYNDNNDEIFEECITLLQNVNRNFK